MKFSIMILSIPSRLQQLSALYEKLQTQIGARKDIEVICLVDNKSMTIGEKRSKILSCSRGQYVAFLDDDDTVSDNYIEEIMRVLDSSSPDVVSFEQDCTVNGKKFMVNFRLGNPHEPAVQNALGEYPPVIKRPPYHMCVWKGVIARNTPIPSISYGEDLAWIQSMVQRCKTGVHISKVLHYYIYSDAASQSIQFKGL